MSETALVTGASGGIGAAIARNLGTDHDVAVHYHVDEEAAVEVAGDVRETGHTASTVQCDIADPSAVAAMIDIVRERHDGIDVLVNNAGVFYNQDLVDIDVETMQRTIRINLEGACYCTKFALEPMRSAGGGRIVSLSSTAGTHGSEADPTYGAAKAGLFGLTRSVARQYTSAGIFANAVAPGPVDTRMFPEHRRPATRERSPIGRLLTPEEIAEPVRMFATTTAMSGQVLTVDGGLYQA